LANCRCHTPDTNRREKGVIGNVGRQSYSIGYVGVSFHEDVAKAGIGAAAARSYDGEFLLPTPQASRPPPHSGLARRKTSA
jgi:ABC-type phosphate transport system substrate-binding protein